MRIGVELRLVTEGNAGGIAMLLRGLLRTLFERHPQHQFICFHTVFNRGLLGEVPENVEQHTLSLGGYFSEVDKLCAKKHVDALIRGYPLEQQIAFPCYRQVVHIPDVQHEQFPEFFEQECLRSRRTAFAQALTGAGAIGTISEFSRQTLLAQPGRQCSDIFLISPALQVEHRCHHTLSDSEFSLIPPGDFFLFPANLWKHKNHERTLQAFERCLESTRHPVEFVFTGHPSGWDDFQKRFGHLPMRHLGFVRPALLRLLMEKARALVFFSLYEGFGMPLLEAFDAGTPVLCSNTTSLPEVAGDAVLSCDPTDIAAMSALMTRILHEPELRPFLAERGRERLKAFTWDHAADNLMEACQRVAQRANESERLPQNIQVSCEWPRFALVTPSCNQGRYIQRTIDSVLTQDYPQINYLVIDGDSTDNTLQILRSYGDRVKWISEGDRGQANAINKGFARVQGDVLAFLNSDDVLLPGAITKAAQYFVKHPQCDMVYGKAHFIDEEDRVLGDYGTDYFSFERLMSDCCISQPAAFWRRNIADKIGPFDESLHFALDYDYWQRLGRAGGSIEYLQEYLACTRMHAEAKTVSRHTEMLREAIEVSMKNAGFASLNYYQGLWHSIAQEKQFKSLLLRRVPGLRPLLSRLHHRWENRATCNNLDVLREVSRALRKHAGRPFRRIRNHFSNAGILAKRLIGLEHGPAVTGYWGDNWIGSNCVVRLSDNRTGYDIHLSGVAYEPMELTVTVDKRFIGKFDLQGGQVEYVRFHVDPGAGRRVELSFSKHLVDAAQRQLSFKLQGTSLFSEQDLAA